MMNSRTRIGFALALGITLFGCGGDEPVFQAPEVTVTTPDGERSFLIRRGPELEEFETFLQPYRG